MLSLITAILFIVGVVNILIALFVFLRDPRLTQNRLFALFSLSLGGWVIGIGGFLLSNSVGFAYGWAKAYYAFPLFVAASMPLFVYAFPKEDKVPRWLWWVIFGGLLALIIPLLSLQTFLTQSLTYHEWGKEIVLNKSHYLLYSLYLLTLFSIGLTHVYRKARRLKGRERSQARAFFWGFLLTSTLGVFFNLFLPWFGNYKLIWLGPLFTNAFIVATGYSIIKHKMFDIRFYVVRAAAYTLTILTLSFLYMGPVLLLLFWLLEYRIIPEKFIIALVVISVAAFYYHNLRVRFDRITAKIFYRDDYDAEEFIAQLNKAVVSNLDLNSMLSSASEIIRRNMKAEFCVFSIGNEADMTSRTFGLQKNQIVSSDLELTASLLGHTGASMIITDYLPESHKKLKKLLKKQDIAVMGHLASGISDEKIFRSYILLGPRKGGNPYNNRDMRILETIIDGLIVAIQNALRFEEIQKFNITLQQKVDDATRQLQRTNAKLVALDETKDDFISMASHQLRTPLTSVKGYLSMVLEGDAGEVTDMQRKMLDQSFVSSQRMVSLIADLLNVSRLKTGKFVIERKRLQLQDVVQEEVNQLVETAASRKQTLKYVKPARFPELMIDETKIRQVIMNFIDNAIYYTPNGGNITVTLKETPTSIELRVKDNGIGVPKHELPRLFTKFYRAGNARRARPDGTGLGLFMAKKVIIAQGGAVIIESEEGKGSTFGFVFPKQKVLAPPIKKPVPVAIAS